MRVKVAKLIREHVGIGNKVEIVLSMTFLHFDHILTQLVLPRDLIARWKVIDFLILIKALIEIAFTGTVAPEDVPIV